MIEVKLALMIAAAVVALAAGLTIGPTVGAAVAVLFECALVVAALTRPPRRAWWVVGPLAGLLAGVFLLAAGLMECDRSDCGPWEPVSAVSYLALPALALSAILLALGWRASRRTGGSVER